MPEAGRAAGGSRVSRQDSDVISEMPNHVLVAFYGGALHGAIRYLHEPVEEGHRYSRLHETWEYDGDMFILLLGALV